MNRRQRIAAVAVAGGVIVAATACSSGGNSSGTQLVNGGTFKVAVPVEPGSLDPQHSANGGNVAIARLAYDTPVTIDQHNHVVPGVVSSWNDVGGTGKWQLTVRKGITCSDGSAMDAKTVAANINYVADPKNGSAFTGAAVPTGAKATADQTAGTVTVTTPSPAPFFVESLQLLYLVCGKGLADRKSLASHSAGSGPYVVSQSVPGDHVTYTLRKGYTWGPPGASRTDAKGIPATVTVQAVTSNTTTGNLLLGRQLNAAQVQGTDEKRLKAAGLYSSGGSATNDDLIFNQAAGKPTTDVVVRRALLQALDLKQLGVVDGGGVGAPATGLFASPKICPGNTVAGNLPDHDLDAAKALLKNAGWTPGPGGTRVKDGKKLKIALLYASNQAPTGAAAEFMEAQWKKLGVAATLVQKPTDQVVSGLLGGTTDYDAVLEPINLSAPAQLVPLLSGPVPPKGANVAGIKNADYNSLTAKAATQAGTAGCTDWNAAEAALYKDAAIAPLATIPDVWWGTGAHFTVDNQGVIIPTSVRLLAQ